VLSRRPARTSVAALVACSAILVTLSPARADTRTQITNAQQRLHALEAQIASEQASLVALQSSIRDSVVKVADGRRLYDAIQAQLLDSQQRRAQIAARYETIRSEIDKLAVGAFIGGPTSGSLQSLDPRSISDATDAMQYLSSIVDHKATLAEEAQTLGAQLKARAAEEATVMMHRAAALGQLQSDQNTLMSAFAQLEMQLVQMAQARAQISVLLVQLAKQLRAEEIAAAIAFLASERASYITGVTLQVDGGWVRSLL